MSTSTIHTSPAEQHRLHRIVRMTFRPDAVDEFLTLFAEVKSHIRAQPGCQDVQLMQDTDWPAVFATFSIWDSDDALQAYRRSAFFRSTWTRTRAMFAAPPKAESYFRQQ